MTYFAFVNKGQNQYDSTWNLTLIDKCKMCHFECHGVICKKFKINQPKVINCYVIGDFYLANFRETRSKYFYLLHLKFDTKIKTDKEPNKILKFSLETPKRRLI